jgi:hypothetical protein
LNRLGRDRLAYFKPAMVDGAIAHAQRHEPPGCHAELNEASAFSDNLQEDDGVPAAQHDILKHPPW